MYTLIDIKNGLVVHCETLTSALSMRTAIGKGVIYNEDNLLTETAIKLARATWGKEATL